MPTGCGNYPSQERAHEVALGADGRQADSHRPGHSHDEAEGREQQQDRPVGQATP